MKRRLFLQGVVGVMGGSLFIGKASIHQEPPAVIPTEETAFPAPAGSVITDDDCLMFPGFFTVFIDGIEAFRMVGGDVITADRNCRVVAFKNFESKPHWTVRLVPGDSLTVSADVRECVA